jgi:cellulose synthase/poly-beta-1,6-N-acetylglucosamine synthase-like glycosyltransferase
MCANGPQRGEVSNPALAATSLPVTAQPGAIVVVPAHNEFGPLWRCLGAVRTAAVAVAIPTQVIVVLDACDDESSTLAGQFGAGVHFVEIDERNVGAARAAGFRYARTELGAVGKRIWYATTDADTEVGGDWLIRQLGWGADLVLGQVRVGEWRHHSEEVAAEYEARYRAETPFHQHIHGANMGFRSEAYWRVGGFASLRSGEDVDLVDRFRAAGMRVCSDDRLFVTTSDRWNGRAPGGFADHLAEVSREVAGNEDRTDEVS